MSDQFETRPGGANDDEPERLDRETDPLDREPEPLDVGPEPLEEDLVPVMGPDEGLVPDDEGPAPEPASAAEYDDDYDDVPPAAMVGTAAEPSSPGWVAAVTGAGLGLIVVQALVLIGTLTQSMAVPRYPGDFFHKLGVVLLSNVGSANGLALLLGAVLAGLPTLVGVRVSEGVRRRQALVFGLGGLLAVLLILGTPIAVRARIHALDVGGQTVDALARRVLATYVAGTLGTALVALAACLGLSRAGRTDAPIAEAPATRHRPPGPHSA